jgi:hypothetical protein
MEKTPQFIREFSKEKNQQERDLRAREIKKVRAEYFQGKNDLTQKKFGLESEAADKKLNIEKVQTDINILKDKLLDISANGLERLINYFEIKKIKAEILLRQEEEEGLKTEQKNIQESLDVVKNDEENFENGDVLRETEKMVVDFYKQEKKHWASSSYDNEDIKKYFSEDYLATLSLEDYALLLKRFPGEMVSHVTRQGIRDHLGHVFHTVGKGEYFNGFMKMLQDGKLRSPLSVRLLEKEKDKAVADMLGLSELATKEEALNHLDFITGEGRNDSGGYADRNAIHFATEEVADVYYGSEKGNEIFVAYPSAFIASQYYFGGQLKDAGGGYWNDQWVWDKEQEGMDLDAGLIFIPADAQVDRFTGSRYKLNENNKPIKNEVFYESFKKMVESEDFLDFASRAKEIVGRLHYSYYDFIKDNIDEKEKIKILPLCQELEDKFGISDKRLQFAALDYQSLFSLTLRIKNKNEGIDDPFFSIESDIDSALENAGVLFYESDNPVKSQDFWENYFSNNLKSKPTKIIYYQDADPTSVLLNWRKEKGINKKALDKSIGFSENSISSKSEVANTGVERFSSIARKVIEDYYSDKI